MLKYIKNSFRRYRLRSAGVQQAMGLHTTLLGGRKGWPLWPDAVDRDSVVYSFGVGENVVWDLAMIEQFDVTVQAFDPTPECVAWVARQQLPARFRFHECGLAAFDGCLDFYPPKKAGRMHYSQEPGRFRCADAAPFSGRVERLSTIARRLGHTHIDVLKMDIEGSEFEALPDMVGSGIPVDQLLIELHYHFPSRSMREGLDLLQQLRMAGYICHFISDRGMEFSFIHQRLLASQQAA